MTKKKTVALVLPKYPPENIPVPPNVKPPIKNVIKTMSYTLPIATRGVALNPKIHCRRSSKKIIIRIAAIEKQDMTKKYGNEK